MLIMANIKHNKVYLVKNFEEDIKGSKLPPKRQVLCFFLHNHIQLVKTVQDSATKTVEKVTEFWDQARIPIQYKQNCIKKAIGLLKHGKV